jgi:hypothetical protein
MPSKGFGAVHGCNTRLKSQAAEEVRLPLALDEVDRLLVGDGARQLGQPILHAADADDTVDPVAVLIQVKLKKLLLVLAVRFGDEGSVRFFVFNPLDFEQQDSVLVAIVKRRQNGDRNLALRVAVRFADARARVRD